MRRFSALFLSVVVVLGTVFGGGALVAAQDSTPESGLAELGLPTLDVTVTATGYEDIPESLEAGRYLVTVTGAEDLAEQGGEATFIQPSGMTAEEFLGALAGPPDETGASPASPIAEGEAVASPPMGGPPPALFDATFAGGTAVVGGQTAQVVLDLPPGEWVVGGGPDASQEPFVFEVTGEMPADPPEPASDATLTMAEYVIEVTNGELTAGQHILKIENVGAQPHFIVWFKGPEGLTEEDVAAVLEADMTGTPAAVDFNPETDLMPVLFTGTQSTEASIWIPVDLEPGTYGLACFFPDIADGMPHAFKGMYTVVNVGE